MGADIILLIAAGAFGGIFCAAILAANAASRAARKEAIRLRAKIDGLIKINAHRQHIQGAREAYVRHMQAWFPDESPTNFRL